MKTTKSIFYIISLLILLFLSDKLKAQTDSTAFVEGNVFELFDDESGVHGATLFFLKLDTANNVAESDSVLSDTSGFYSIEVDTGFYYIIPVKEYYEPLTYYQRFYLKDSLYNLDFEIERPMLHLNADQIDVSGPYDNPKHQQVIISNTGSGKLGCSVCLYLHKELPQDAYPIQFNPDDFSALERLRITPGKSGNNERFSPRPDDWKLLYHDDHDQLQGNHDLNNLWMQQDEDNVYIKVDFYDEIASFDNFFFIFLMNTDRDYSTGEPGGGFDYAFVSANFSGYIGTVVIQYIGSDWYYLMDAPYSDMHLNNDYIAFGTNKVLFFDTDVMLAYAFVVPGQDNYGYIDAIPDWQDMDMFLFSVESDQDMELDKLYGEAFHSGSDTITVTIQPGIADNPLDTFFIAFVCNDDSLPVRVVPVYIERPENTITPNIAQTEPYFHEIYPNPFSESTLFRYHLDKASKVTLTIYQPNGKLVKTLINAHQIEGSKTVEWDATNNDGNRVTDGVYLYTLRFDDQTKTGKLIFIE